MSARCFVDSNVLVYAHDAGAGERHRLAVEMVRRLWEERTGVISIQVLQEVWVNLRRKASQPVSRQSALQLIEDYCRWEVVVPSPDAVIEAIRIEERHGISFWDALIVQAAQTAGVDRLYSEDLNAGQSYGGVVVIDPFAA